MDPRTLFPWLALGFALLAAWRVLRERRLGPASRTWALLAVVFAAVSWWLHARA